MHNIDYLDFVINNSIFKEIKLKNSFDKYDKEIDNIQLKLDYLIQQLYFGKKLSEEDMIKLNAYIKNLIDQIYNTVIRLDNEQLKLYNASIRAVIVGSMSLLLSLGLNPNLISIFVLSIVDAAFAFKKMLLMNKKEKLNSLLSKAKEYKYILEKKGNLTNKYKYI